MPVSKQLFMAFEDGQSQRLEVYVVHCKRMFLLDQQWPLVQRGMVVIMLLFCLLT